MNSSEHHDPPSGTAVSSNGVVEAADRLYCAECALHAAFESHVDSWISAAYERLHEAVADHVAALAACAA